MPLDPERLKALLLAAIRRPDPADLAGLLDRECGDDLALRRRLEAIFSIDDAPPGEPEVLATITPGGEPPRTLADSSPPAAPGDATGLCPGLEVDPLSTIPSGSGPGRPGISPPGDGLVAGRYRIVEEIGEGGMGSVYLAEQEYPVRRRVALKLIKAGMDSRQVLARFESERQALALMDHPNIAKVFDAGTTDAGRPFFVMELVAGVSLTAYCDGRRLDLPARLALFRQVCAAVQHAHQKGIIHRDLKPGNILVESAGPTPVPKVIDFGLAKAIGGDRLSEMSVETAFGQVAGTPLYMAPEQAAADPADIDTRADVYALGVILYELLCGSTPIRRETIRRAGLEEMLRLVREGEAPPPSGRLVGSEGLPGLAASRGTEPSRLGRLVRGDLDWIAMKALAKERDRRYESATALADDVGRFLDHEPVVAGPPSSSYRLRKFARRHRGQVVAASLVVLALVAGVVGTSIGLVEAKAQAAEARRQGRIARAEAEAKEAARRDESDQRRQAERRLGQIEAVNEILGSIFEDLDPKRAEAEGRPLRAVLGDRLDAASRRIEGEAIGEPLAVARMQATLGLSLRNLGDPDRAVALLGKALATFAGRLGRADPAALEAIDGLALAEQDAGRYDRARPLFEEALALRTAKFGESDRQTLRSLRDLAGCLRAGGDVKQALNKLLLAFTLQKRQFGREDPETLASMVPLASLYKEIGQTDRALPLFEEAFALQKARLGPDAPETLRAMADLGNCYVYTLRRDRGLPLLEDALARRKARFGPGHPDTLASMNDLGDAYRSDKKADLAVPLLEQTLALRKAKLGADHPDTLVTMSSLASACLAAGKVDRGRAILEEALPLMKARLGLDHPVTLNGMTALGGSYEAAGDPARAAAILAESLPLRIKAFGYGHPGTTGTRNMLLNLYRRLGQYDRVVPLAVDAADLAWMSSGKASPEYGAALAMLGSDCLKAGRWADAERALRTALLIREMKQPDDWSTFNAKSLLGGALLAQGKRDEAGPLLRDGYEGMKRRAAKIPEAGRPRLAEALDRLIDLAKATGEADDLKAWTDERAGSVAKP